MTTLCQPCEPLGKVLVKKWSRVSRGFYIKSGRWYCPCDKRVDYCCSVECKNLSEQVDLKIGESMYNKARKEVLRQMKKTGKMPKQSTIEKYKIKDVEIKEYMEEVVFCQPCEKEFYKKGKHWYCLCDKRSDRCSNTKCKAIGVRLGLKVGGSICEHNRERSRCKPCKGGEVCTHNKRRSICIDCNGSQICEHNIQRSHCKKCNGSQICEHNRQRSVCKPCGGSQICIHNKTRSFCVQCGGSQICKHNIQCSWCKQCNGSQICEHNRRRPRCKDCNPQGHITSLRRGRRWDVTNSSNPTHTLDDLGMTSKEWYVYLSKTFEDRYGRPRNESDEVHIDEIIPCSAWNIPDDNKYCWHYLNSQWLLAVDNLSKGSSYSQTDKDEMIKRIDIALSEIKTRVSI
jgi:hypothetical protein